MAAAEDNVRVVELQYLADPLLVFVCLDTLYGTLMLIWLQDGLFAAFLSAFLVFTIPQLQPDNTEIAMKVLIHISQQLGNSTIPAYVPTEFTASPNTVVVNLLFFLSLALVLIDAFLAMLVKSWLQEFDRGWRKYTVADLRAQERERRLQGLERWKLAELITLRPALIQSSLLFFSIGLIVLLFPLHLISAILSSVALMASFGFYVFTTYVSVRDVHAPFSSPFSRLLASLMNVLGESWRGSVPLVARTVQRIIPGISPHTISLDPPHAHDAGADPSQETFQSSTTNDGVGHPSSMPQGNEGVKKREVVTRSRYQIDPRTHVDILERLVLTTPEAMENIPVFLELLDQPVKDPTLWPFNVEKWKALLQITLGLLGDPSTFSGSVARTIARNAAFWYDGGTADEQLSQKLKLLIGHMGSGPTGRRMPLNDLFAGYLDYNCGFYDTIRRDVFDTIAYLEPSNAADAELLWVVNTFSMSMAWQRFRDSSLAYRNSLHLFAAVLTYVSSTEQSRRSQVPLTAAVIHAMHTIKSAIDHNAIDSILGHHILPGTVLATSDSVSMAFHRVDTLDLWSDHCVELASALLQPQTHWSGTNADHVWMFQLPLIAALYIDSTRQAGRASTTFAKLLKVTNIPDITMSVWAWADAYDYTKLAGYWYMALFQEPIYQNGTQNSPSQDIGNVIAQTIERCSEIRLSALYLLDASVKHLRATASDSIDLNRSGSRLGRSALALSRTPPTGVINHRMVLSEPFDPWVFFHLETLFPRSSILMPVEFEQLVWTDTPEQVHIAKARLALYDSFEGKEHNGTKQLRPDPQVLTLFIWSNDYEACTGAFKWCLNLVTTSQPNASAMFIPETVGHGWIEHLVEVLCGDSLFDPARSWEFLAEHLVPKWTMLSSSWRGGFASALLFSKVNPPGMPELHAYESLAKTLHVRGHGLQSDQVQGFLPFLVDVVERTKAGLTWDQVASIENWLAHLPTLLENPGAHTQLEIFLATRKQELVGENIGVFAELPMADSKMDE